MRFTTDLFHQFVIDRANAEFQEAVNDRLEFLEDGVSGNPLDGAWSGPEEDEEDEEDEYEDDEADLDEEDEDDDEDEELDYYDQADTGNRN